MHIFKENIWSVNLANMILIRKLHVGFQFLLCVIDIYSKYAWLLPLKDRKGIIITKAFQENQGRLSKKNDRDIYSIHNEGKSVVAERFIRTLKNKIYKYMTSISKNVYIGKLADIGNK